MTVMLRIHHLLGLDRRGHATLKDLAKEIGISQFQLKSLINNKTPTISRDSLDKVTNYLLAHHIVSVEDLPEVLFSYQPDKFWQMVSERRHIQLCMGVRWDPNWRDHVVMAADSMLQANILYRLTGTSEQSSGGRRNPRRRTRPLVIDARMVRAWVKRSPTENRKIQRAAAEFYEGYTTEPNNRALICMGSVKSNPAIEPLISASFRGLRAFRNEDHVEYPHQRGCPFMMLVRPNDPKPPSSSCGTHLSRKTKGKGPGIYFAVGGDEWDFAPCDDNNDAAIVFFHLDKGSENLEMVLGGFSGYSTRCLAHLLRNEGEDLFWPPNYSSSNVLIGLSIVKFHFRPSRRTRDQRSRPEERLDSTEVIPIPESVIEKRV